MTSQLEYLLAATPPDQLADIIGELPPAAATALLNDPQFQDANTSINYPTPLDLGLALDTTTKRTPALELINQQLVKAHDTPDDRLIITMPPQEGKSLLSSRRFPLWALTRNPETRIAIASYAADISRRFGRAIRNDILSNSDLLPFTIQHGISTQKEWEINGHDGGVYTTGVSGQLTSRSVDLMIIDDPVKNKKQADSQTYRDEAWEWLTHTVMTRLSPGASVILIQTRWHEDDLAGRILERHPNRWRTLNITAQAEHHNDPLNRQPGEYMQSARGRTHEQWEDRKRSVGTQAWEAMYQGNPAPPKGVIIERDWIQYYDTPPTEYDQIIQSWDLAFGATETSSYVVGQVWAKKDANYYLLDQYRARADFVATVQAIKNMTAKWPQARLKLIEKKANGPAVLSALRRDVTGMKPINPQGSKETRLHAVTPLFEGSNVYIPNNQTWTQDYVEELVTFPSAAHDDQVDATTQALERLSVAYTPRTAKVG